GRTVAAVAWTCKRHSGCTFDEDSDASLCDYRQGQEDDFDWQLIRTYSLPHATPDLLRGQPPYSIFSYILSLCI
ncbi:hypothetical protein NHX12_023542, partial [Muraenolepis orangiensis]